MDDSRPEAADADRERTTLEHWHAVHDLIGNGVGLRDFARRLNLGLNTVKRYPRAPEPDRLRRPRQYRACLVDPYREHLRRRRIERPGMPVKNPFEEIRALDSPGSLNLLHKYLNQGRHESGRSIPTPHRFMSWPGTCPSSGVSIWANSSRRPEMTALARLVHDSPSSRASAAEVTSTPGSQLSGGPSHPSWLPFSPASSKTTTRHGGAHDAVQQRSGRGCECQNEADREADVRQSRIQPHASPHPSGLISPPPPLNVRQGQVNGGRHPAITSPSVTVPARLD
ncbi:hypothetical protein OK006_9490 [Actinobacteria bacterium OK006]|nr:hypothetical protein OK006_9490 [Actinobacteria bacterium OK006]